MFKVLPSEYGDFGKLKLRHRQSRKDLLCDAFNKSFQLENFIERSIVTYTSTDLLEQLIEPWESIYRVYPVNGYKYAYHPATDRIALTAMQHSLQSQLTEDDTSDILLDLIQTQYKSTNLQDGIFMTNEIIFYDIPLCYVTRL